MNSELEPPLFLALRSSGRLPPDVVDAALRVCEQFADQPVQLADELKALNCLTNYQFRKIQTGRLQELLFGPYFIMERIGEGGMGKVYRAIDHLGREVALKTIRPNLMSNKTVIERYKREARAAASLEHPNIVKLYDADEIVGRYFLAMEFVDGCDLSRLTKDLLREKRSIHPAEAAEYIRQAALGLQHAHDKNLIHRDIKPSNLLVSGERALPGTGGKAILKILDMGLVRSLTEDENEGMELTRDGTVVGTPDYMSPEQAKNSSHVDHRADIYSLGCTLFYILKGQSPYSDGTAIDKLIRHQLDPVPDIRQFRPDVSPGLASVIRKMLAKKPADRQQSGTEVARELSLYTEEANNFDFGNPAKPVEFEPVELTPSHTPVPAMKGLDSGPTSQPGKVRKLRPVIGAPRSANINAQDLQVGTVTPVKKSPKPIVKATPDASSNGSSGSTTGKGRESSTPTTPIRTRRTLTTRKPEKRKATALGWPLVLAAIGGVVLIGGILVVAVLFSQGHNAITPSTSAVPTPTEPKASDKKPALGGLVSLIPDDTSAVLVLHPKPYAEKLKSETALGQEVKDFSDHLKRYWHFDPQSFEQVLVALRADPQTFVTIGQGDTLTRLDDFRRNLGDLKRMQLSTDADGNTLMQVRLAVNPKRKHIRGLLLVQVPAYILGTADLDVAELMKDQHNRKAPVNTDAQLLKHLSEPERANPATVADLVADGRLQYRSKPAATQTSLVKSGVEWLHLKVNLTSSFRMHLQLHGQSDLKLTEFLEQELPAILEAHLQGETGKAMANLVRASLATSVLGEANGLKTRTVQFDVDWVLFHGLAAQLLDAPAWFTGPKK